MLGSFKTTYFDYKAKAAVECPSNPWRVQNNAVFARIDAFLERCHDVLDLTTTIAQFQKVGMAKVIHHQSDSERRKMLCIGQRYGGPPTSVDKLASALVRKPSCFLTFVPSVVY